MGDFYYEGRRVGSGDKVSGRSHGRDATATAQWLRSQGVLPTEIRPVGGEQRSWPWPMVAAVSDGELLFFTRQMAAVCRAGVPLARAVQGLAESSPSLGLRRALVVILRDLQSGHDLSTAMATHPALFDNLYVKMVRMGEEAGRLEESFNQLHHYLLTDRESRQRLRAAMRYPLLVIIALVGALLVVGIWVIPTFGQIFQTFGAKLPWITRAMLSFSNFLIQGAPWLLMAAILVVVAVRFLLARPAGRLWWDRWRFSLPFIGPIQLQLLLARLARGLAMGFRSGLPMVQTLAVVGEALDNLFAQQGINGMARGVERGASFGQVAQESGLFTPLALQMVIIGEETGSLDRMMEESADFYEREASHALATLQAALEPVLTLLAAGLVLLLALAVFLPMWELGHVALRH